ncbi:DNA mismatch repair protein [Pochonia chlamydosporia 170]|uniref:DNA mismatch repair protein n=1 Tax=Pochonia chlamydosporia 170 TaxID=1380566 RepID=A0A179FG64_METCM|nr:DNA mismatch repair protein [Pochonia chlamydosporia 170]OAQ64397.1 DNA mismatch repair protein [Pochonia chlamydosporia 170]
MAMATSARTRTPELRKSLQMGHLLALPPELVQGILSSLPTSDILAASLVNKRIHQAALTCLYADITITWTLDGPPPMPIMLVLRSILDRPDLGRLVRHLRLDGKGFDRSTDINRTDPMPPPLHTSVVPMRKASSVIQSTKMLAADHWIQGISSGVVDAVVALLMAMMPNLVSLYLGPNFTIRNGHTGAMLRSSICQPHQDQVGAPAFTSLQSVTVTSRTDELSHRSEDNSLDVLPFLYLPNLEYLSVSIDNSIDFVWPGGYAPRPTRIKCLELYRVRESRLKLILATLNDLEKLSWRWFYYEYLDKHVSKPIIELDVILQALQPIQHSLLELDIGALFVDCEDTIDFSPSLFTIQSSLDDLSQFHKLQNLSLPWVFVKGLSESSGMNFPTFPASLEQLTLTNGLFSQEIVEWEDGDIFLAVESWLTVKGSLMTSLRTINPPVPKDWYARDSTNEDNIQAAAKWATALSTKTGHNVTWRKSPDEIDDRGIY